MASPSRAARNWCSLSPLSQLREGFPFNGNEDAGRQDVYCRNFEKAFIMAISGRCLRQSPGVNHLSWESDCGPRQSTHQKKPKSSLLQAPNPERHLIATLQLSTFTKWFALVLHTNVRGPPRQTLGIPIPIPMYFIFLRCIFSFVVRFLVSLPICAGCSSFVTLSQERGRARASWHSLALSQNIAITL